MSFQNDGFATMLCPGWMLGVIEGNAAGVEGWDIANVFPGGGGNWGGSFLTVPAMGENQAEAKKLANWLTAPEQQIKAFVAKGTFPSQEAALTDPVLLEPVMLLTVSVPEDVVGDVIGDLSSRRGKPLGMEPKGSATEVKAEVPMAEVLDYAPDLRAITGGRGDYTMEFAHHEEVPAHLAQQVIAEASSEEQVSA